MKMKQVWALAAAAALLVMPLSGCSADPADGGNGSGTVKIGVMGPKTGSLSQYGQAVLNAVEIAKKEINDNGGILGGKMIETIVEDEKGDVTEAINVYNKLVGSDNVVAILGDVTSAPSKAVAQKAAVDKIPMITASGTDADITKAGENVFRTCFIDPYQGQLMASYAAKKLNAKTAAILYDSGDSYSTGIADAFEAAAKELGITVTNKLGYASKSTDFNAQLTQLKTSNPDVVMLPVYYNDVMLILKQAKQQGLTCKFLGADGWDGVEPLLEKDPSLNDMVQNAYFCSQYSAVSDDQDLQNFLKTYKDTYGVDANMFAVLGYDTMHILAQAIDKAGSTDSDKIVAALKETNYTGLTGTTVFDEERNPVREAIITTFENGKYKVLEPYKA